MTADDIRVCNCCYCGATIISQDMIVKCFDHGIDWQSVADRRRASKNSDEGRPVCVECRKPH